MDGQVTLVRKGENDRGGYLIRVNHTYMGHNIGIESWYMHLNDFNKMMGEYVKAGEVIGYVGKTGLATGPHLHYTFYDNGRPINPLKIKNTSGDPISPESMKRFNLIKKEMLAWFDKMDNIRLPLVINEALNVHYNKYCQTQR